VRKEIFMLQPKIKAEKVILTGLPFVAERPNTYSS
jgi:hypothetical protein